MNFQEAERAYQDLRAQYSAGKLSNSDFEAQVSKLKVQDAEGRWWQIGVQSGEWYVHDGQKWSKGRPPIQSAGAAPAPGAPPEVPAAAAGAGAAGLGGTPAAAGAPAPKPTPPKRVVTPRLFSAAPPGRAGGLPTPALIGIIALVAIIGLGVIIAAFLFLSGQLGGTATAPRTATPIAVVAPPTTGLPTIAPQATNTAVVLPTLPPVAIAPTAAITPTRALTGTAPAPSTGTGVTTTTGVTATRSVTTTAPTATRRPVTPTVTAAPKAVATATPSLKPGVYVSSVRTSPVQPNPGDPTTFYVTFFNNSGDTGPTQWIVKIFKCEAACTADELADNRSLGETPKVTTGAPPGTKELAAGPWTVGTGVCNLIASPYYVDQASGQVLPYPDTKGDPRVYYQFKKCQ